MRAVDYFQKLSIIYQNYNTRILSKGRKKEFYIINPNKAENIIITLRHNKLTFYFSYQHAHFDRDVNELIRYINLFLSDSYVALEFFDGDRHLFGGGVSIKEVNILSIDELANRFGLDEHSIDSSIRNSVSKAISYKSRSWSGLKDTDAIIKKTGDRYSVEQLY